MALVTTRMGGVCEKPSCEREQYRVYTGENGNRLALCEDHYFQFVADRSDTIPFRRIQKPLQTNVTTR